MDEASSLKDKYKTSMKRDTKGRFAKESRWGWLLIMIALVGIVMVVLMNSSHFVEVEQQIVEKEVEVTPEWAQDEEAVKAAQAVIHRKELEAEKAQLQVELEERQNRLDEIDKQLGLF